MEKFRKAMRPPSRGESPSNLDKSEPVKVCVRIKDSSVDTTEGGTSSSSPWLVDTASVPNRIYLDNQYNEKFRKSNLSYSYDAILTGSDNSLIYNSIAKEIVNSVMEGFHGTIFAYGQTSSGKTYTMTGTEEEPGIIPQAVDDIFKFIRKTGDSKEFLLRVTYIEIYNETIRDLLATEVVDLKIHEDKYRGVFVAPLKEEIVTSPKHVMRVIDRGEANRHISANDYHEHSSRSHTIFQIIIESCDNRASKLYSVKKMGLATHKKGPSQSGIKLSYLNLIDLAGSEKYTSDKDRRKEASFINKSLLTLGAVISKMSESKSGHVPFRDSKLTRILQTTLSGNCRVGVICTINDAGHHCEESISTLKFGSRLKNISTRAQRNQVLDDKALLQKYLDEINELRGKLTNANSVIDESKSQELECLRQQNQKYEEEMMEMHLARTTYKERIDHLTKLILSSSSMGDKVFKRSRPLSVRLGHRSTVSVNPRLSILGKHRENNERLDWALNEIQFKNKYIQSLEALFALMDPDNPDRLSPSLIFEKFTQIQVRKTSWEEDSKLNDIQSDKIITEKVSTTLGRVASMRISRRFSGVSDLQSPHSKPEDPSTIFSNLNVNQPDPSSVINGEEFKEMDDIIEEQNRVIMELEQERKYNAKTVADLKDRIRQLELQQFRRAERAALNSLENTDANHQDKLQRRIAELELALEAETEWRKKFLLSNMPTASSQISASLSSLPPIPPPRLRPPAVTPPSVSPVSSLSDQEYDNL